MACKIMDLNPIDHLLDLLKRKVRAQPLQLNIRELTRVIYQMCAAIPKQYINRHIISTSTRYLAVDATPGGCTQYWNEIRYDMIWFCSFFVLRMSMLTLKFKFVPVIKNAVLFYMLGIDYIKPICFFLYFSPKMFPKL